MSKSKNSDLKFSIQNLIDLTPSCQKKDQDVSNYSLKRIMMETESSSSSAAAIHRPIPLLKPQITHPCWSFLSQLTNKNLNGNLPFNSSLIILSKMNQVWEQIHRTQISPSIKTAENDEISDEDIYMDTSSIRRHPELDIDDDDEDEDEVDDEEDDEEGECSTSTGDKNNTTSNSEENDKLKNYPCTQCGKVK
jgi:hypothetical protein